MDERWKESLPRQRTERNESYGYGQGSVYAAARRRQGGGGWRTAFFALLTAVVLAAAVFGLPAALGTGQQTGGEGNIYLSESLTPTSTAADESGYAGGTAASAGELTPQEVAARVIPSVVCIQNYADGMQVSAEGSGIVYSEDGYIVTNAHVVNGARSLGVIFSDGETAKAQLVGIDTATDLAVIRVDKTGLTPAEFADSADTAVAETVMAVGNPGGHTFNSSVTMGVVSAVDRPLELTEGYTMNTIQTDAAINPGNSGGPLVNMRGQVIGINSAKYAASGYEGLGFAITTGDALPIISDLIENGHVSGRAMLGISSKYIQQAQAARYGLPAGLYVYEVMNSNAGSLAQGDVITEVEGVAMDSDGAIRTVLNEKKPGESVEITFYRAGDGRAYTTTVTLVEFTG